MVYVDVTDETFEGLLKEAIDKIPKPYDPHLQNLAFILEDDRTPDQRVKLRLYPNETLYGLYEGVPLSQRQGTTKLLPDKITLFVNPICWSANSLDELKEQIRHTLWHEIAHYYGLNHAQIRELE